jgi:hypothetical protein
VSRPTRGRTCFLPVRGYHPLWPAFPDGSGSYTHATGLVPVRSPLLGESLLMSFPPATEMFQFAGFASILRSIPLARWVAPFGDLRIIGCSPLPEAYRRVPRPSSPLGAKASTKCPYVRSRTRPISMRRHTPRHEIIEVRIHTVRDRSGTRRPTDRRTTPAALPDDSCISRKTRTASNNSRRVDPLKGRPARRRLPKPYSHCPRSEG